MHKKRIGILRWILLVVITAMLFSSFLDVKNAPKPMEYSTLVTKISEGKVSELYVEERTATATISGKKYACQIQSAEYLQNDVGEEIKAQAKEGKLKYKIAPKTTSWVEYLMPISSILMLVLFFFLIFGQGGAKGGGGGGFTKSQARLNTGDNKVNFGDVAGAKEEKEELSEIVEFLKNPQKFIELGARIPKGVLLLGPPGTGKTLLARAVAGEAGVPFFSISGSDFVELYVGVGASRVRDMFAQAKKSRPCIIFIDEIDAVGRRRGAGMGGGHDEREQTLNQLLVEMDGFGKNEGIIIMAATNRPDILDPALLRPGRFDREIVVGKPDCRGREEILRVHSKNKKVSKTVDFSKIAKQTSGYTGADLENVMNEAAIFAARRGKAEIDEKDIEDANIKVMMGPEKVSQKVTDEERKLTAYHEAGHAVLAQLVSKRDTVRQVSIIPRGRAGGYTMHTPKEDIWFWSKKDMLAEIIVLLGGRAAEELVLDDISNGASSDLKRATGIAREMVAKYGMSDELGPVCYDSDEEVFLGRDFGHSKAYSETVATLIDKEVEKLIKEQYNKAKTLLSENSDKLKNVAEALLEHEVLDETEFLKYYEKGDIKDETGN